MPIGIMEYLACLSPRPVKWAASFLDINSNCDIAIEHLNLAISNSYYSWIEASNVLTYIYLHILRDYDSALKIINPIFKKYPGHPFFAFLKGEALAKSNRLNDLDKMMPKLIEFSKSGPFLQQNECQLKLAYIRALIFFNNGNYDETINQTNLIIDNYHMEFDWLKGFSYLLQGKSYDILGKRDKAKKAYKKVLEMDDYYPEVEEARLFISEAFIAK